MSLNWDIPLVLNRLGIITSYDVLYEAIEMDGTLIESKIKSDIVDTSTILNGLHEYTNYTISVRARTAEGPGPYSDVILMLLTNESRTYTCQCIY